MLAKLISLLASHVNVILVIGSGARSPERPSISAAPTGRRPSRPDGCSGTAGSPRSSGLKSQSHAAVSATQLDSCGNHRSSGRTRRAILWFPRAAKRRHRRSRRDHARTRRSVCSGTTCSTRTSTAASSRHALPCSGRRAKRAFASSPMSPMRAALAPPPSDERASAVRRRRRPLPLLPPLEPPQRPQRPQLPPHRLPPPPRRRRRRRAQPPRQVL